MDAYAPTSTTVLIAVAGSALACLLAGYLIQHTCSRALAWIWVGFVIAATDHLLTDEGAGFRMLALLVLMAYAMKAIVGVEGRRRGRPPLSLRNWLAFAAIWFGMLPRQFARSTRGVRPLGGRAALARGGVAWLLAGVITIVIARQLFATTNSVRGSGLVFVLGFSMVLHFGLISVIAAGLRTLGYDVGALFHAPWRAISLHEFWSRRWNVGFSEMTTIAVYRPTVRWLGRSGALMLGFLASGLLHEVACSVPVGAGFGLPTLYFTLHGLAVLAEHELHRRGKPLRGWLGRVWVYSWVLLPIPLLFHAPFLRGIVEPLL